ncbi:MAG: hypothetical protein B7Z37_28900 [Verrucomicrobia bacterium 12-59-8]|nr:MAG: hypothetical protein B7Z37_28900 [Verrucomicrobia bacterium 12-59-8]
MPVPQVGDRQHFLNIGVSHHRLVRNPTPDAGQILAIEEWNGVELAWYKGRDVPIANWRVLEPEDPIKIDFVEVTRLEGPIEQCDEPVKCHHEIRKGDGRGGMFHDDWTVSPFYIAQHTLDRWGQTMDDQGGYDKCRYVIQWGPEDSYTGRFDLTKPADELRDVFKNELFFWSGLAGTPFQLGRKNAVERWSDEEIRQRYVDLVDKHPDSRDFFRRLLAKYEI